MGLEGRDEREDESGRGRREEDRGYCDSVGRKGGGVGWNWGEVGWRRVSGIEGESMREGVGKAGCDRKRDCRVFWVGRERFGTERG